MTTKFLKDGRKVVVVGQLNNTETIVQEIYVTDDGQEFPGGENFVVKTLLDKPAETWKAKETRKLDARYEKLRAQVKQATYQTRAIKDRSEFWERFRHAVAKTTADQLQPLLNIIEGRVTHCLLEGWHPQIVSIKDREIFYEGRYDGHSFRALTIASDRHGRIKFLLSDYASGHGGSCHTQRIHYCLSHEDAIAVAQERCNEDCEDYLRETQARKKEGKAPCQPPTKWLEIEGVTFPPAVQDIWVEYQRKAANAKAQECAAKINELKAERKRHLRTVEDLESP